MQNLYLGADRPDYPLNMVEVIDLYAGMMPKIRDLDEKSLRFALSTVESAVKTKPYTDPPTRELEYNFLYAV